MPRLVDLLKGRQKTKEELKTPKNRTPEEKEQCLKDAIKRANKKYQQTDAYKDYKREYYKKKVFMNKIKDYEIEIDETDKYEDLKNRFIEKYGKDKFNKIN